MPVKKYRRAINYVIKIEFYSDLPNKRTGTITDFWEKALINVL